MRNELRSLIRYWLSTLCPVIRLSHRTYPSTYVSLAPNPTPSPLRCLFVHIKRGPSNFMPCGMSYVGPRTVRPSLPVPLPASVSTRRGRRRHASSLLDHGGRGGRRSSGALIRLAAAHLLGRCGLVGADPNLKFRALIGAPEPREPISLRRGRTRGAKRLG